MAKVLACPSCGNKHSLEEIDSTDSFSCYECRKTLSVPEAAKQFMKQTEVLPKEETSGEVVVVARSSLSNTTVQEEDENGVKVVGKSGSVQNTEPSAEPSIVPESPEKIEKPVRQPSLKEPISSTGSLISWVLAIPAGFILVVIIPRLFGLGFHASDFVGIITTQGLGRFKILATLIILWSIATVLCLFVIEAFWTRFIGRKKSLA